MDLLSISASLKAAIEIGRALKDGEEAFATAEWKLKLAEMMERVADSRTELAAAQEESLAQEKEIARLKAAFEERAAVIRHGDGYYRAKDGNPAGQANCARCWDEDQKLRRLTLNGRNHQEHICPVCKMVYNRDMTSMYPD